MRRKVAEILLDHGISGYNREESLEQCNKNIKRKGELLSTAKLGENDSVARLLDEGVEITSKDRYGNTGLHLIAARGHDTVVKTFLNKGIDVNIRGCGH